MKKLINATLVIIGLLILSSCSVGMALSGKEQKDTRIIFKGAPRVEVINRLGFPANSKKDDEGNYVDTYYLVLGNEPDAGRASAHLALDFFTLGLWEIAATPMEMATTTESRSALYIYYDSQERIKEFDQIIISND